MKNITPMNKPKKDRLYSETRLQGKLNTRDRRQARYMSQQVKSISFVVEA